MRYFHSNVRSHRTAFTLVEMLVAVTLVLLIMTLFAQVFQIAGSSMSTQRGIAENDQRARLITGLLRADLDKRTMRLVMPFEADEDVRSPNARIDERRGYFYYAENDPNDDTDDILQLTTQVTLSQQSADQSPYAGVAKLVSDPTTQQASINAITTTTPSSFTVTGDWRSFARAGDSIWVIGSSNGNNGRYRVSVDSTLSGSDTQIQVSGSIPSATFSAGQDKILFANEPDFDDGLPSNSAGSSAAAEVVYFLRAGTLYRRVLLIRDARTLEEAQPRFNNGNHVLVTAGTPPNGNYPVNGATTTTFWRDFDYSAFYFEGNATSTPANVGLGVYFHGTGPSLYNGTDGEALVTDGTAPATTQPVSLGLPQRRFGHNPRTGFPREYLNVNGTASDLTDDTIFMGRFTAQETASTAFSYPGFIPPNNPYTRTLNATTGDVNVIDEFEDSPPVRRGDDILLTNVLAFDVKLRDPRTGVFVDLGDNSTGGNATLMTSTNTTYSPATRLRFDTWHPNAVVNTNANPPFRPTDVSGNPVAIGAIQIVVRYQDQVDGRMRQATLTHSLTDRP